MRAHAPIFPEGDQGEIEMPSADSGAQRAHLRDQVDGAVLVAVAQPPAGLVAPDGVRHLAQRAIRPEPHLLREAAQAKDVWTLSTPFRLPSSSGCRGMLVSGQAGPGVGLRPGLCVWAIAWRREDSALSGSAPSWARTGLAERMQGEGTRREERTRPMISETSSGWAARKSTNRRCDGAQKNSSTSCTQQPAVG